MQILVIYIHGNYILKEIGTNPNYVINNQEFTVNVEFNGYVKLDIQNDYKEGNIKVIKIDKDNHEIRLKDVEFELYSEEFGRVIGTYKTDINGEIFIPNLRIRQIYFA